MKILAQPDLVTCGPTCLHAIYAYYQDTLSLDNVISQIEYLASGGTLAALLGNHALKRGYQVTMHSVNVHLLDPTWFKKKNVNLLEKLKKQASSQTDPKITHAIEAYIQFLELGGIIKFSDFNFTLLEKYLKNKIPLLSGIDATYFYQSARERVNQKGIDVSDEFAGKPSGHFIVIYDYETGQKLCIADPYVSQSVSPNHYYKVTYNHWLHSLLLGITTYDSELLVIEPKI